MKRIRLKSRKNILRLFSLVFSFFVWLYVISSAEVEIQKFIPINIVLPKGYSLVSAGKTEMSIKVSGPRVFVRKFLQKQTEYRVERRDYYKKGQSKYRVILNQLKLSLPLGVKLKDFSPKEISFKIGKTRTKTVPVKVNLDPKLSKNFEVKSLSVDPEKIKITGASQSLRGVKFIPTKLVSESMLLNEESVEIDLEQSNKYLDLEQSYAVLSYKISSKVTEFTFAQIPIIFQSEKLIKSAFPKTVQVKVRGNKNILNSDLRGKIQILAKIPKSSENKMKIKLLVDLPENIELVEITPAQVDIITE